MPRVERRQQPAPGARRAPSGAAPARAASRRLVDGRLLAILLFLITLIAYSPLVVADFTLWDDARTIAHNPRLNPPSVSNLLYFWDPRHPYMDLYVPVTYTVWSVVALAAYVPQADPSGVHLNPWLFHLLNVLLHAGAVLVVFALLRRLLRDRPLALSAAAAGAALFALHPVQVEPVGWASGTKDVLFGLFSLLALWQYVQFAEATGSQATDPKAPDARSSWSAHDGGFALNPRRLRLHYALGLTFFVLAMLSKPTAVVVPLAAGTLDLLILRRPLKRVAIALVPWLLLSLPIVIEGKLAQPTAHVHRLIVPLHLRPLIAADAVAFYLYKLVFPVRLGIHYDRSPITVLAHGWERYTWILPVLVGALLWIGRRRAPWLMAGGALLVIGVLPVLGLVPFEFQDFSTVADHYLYLAMLGPALALAFALSRGEHDRPSSTGSRAWIVVGVVLLLLGVRSFAQTFTWRDSITLFQQAVRVNPDSSREYTNLGEAYMQTSQYPQALQAYKRAAELEPNEPSVHSNLAAALVQVDQLEAAKAEYERSLQLDPTNPDVSRSLTQLLKMTKREAPGPLHHPASGATNGK